MIKSVKMLRLINRSPAATLLMLTISSSEAIHQAKRFIKRSDKTSKNGIALLLVVVLLSALLSISFGIFAVVFGQILISGEIADSSIAFYAADEGIERTLYRDRIQQVIADGYTEEAPAASGGCYAVSVAKSGGNTTVTISGQYRCGDNQARVVKRGFKVRY